LAHQVQLIPLMFELEAPLLPGFPRMEHAKNKLPFPNQ